MIFLNKFFCLIVFLIRKFQALSLNWQAYLRVTVWFSQHAIRTDITKEEKIAYLPYQPS